MKYTRAHKLMESILIVWPCHNPESGLGHAPIAIVRGLWYN